MFSIVKVPILSEVVVSQVIRRRQNIQISMEEGEAKQPLSLAKTEEEATALDITHLVYIIIQQLAILTRQTHKLASTLAKLMRARVIIFLATLMP